MTQFDRAKIEQKIISCCTDEMELELETATDVAFHMTDWLSDLEKLVECYNEPDMFSSEQLNDILLAFLIHAPNHIAAAAKLFAGIDVSDIFNAGAVEIDEAVTQEKEK